MKSVEDKSIKKFVDTLRDLWFKMSEEQRRKTSKKIISIMAKNLEEKYLLQLKQSEP